MRGMLLADSKRLFTNVEVQLLNALGDLGASSLVLRTEWLHPRNGAATRGQPVRSGASASPGRDRVIQKYELTAQAGPVGITGAGSSPLSATGGSNRLGHRPGSPVSAAQKLVGLRSCGKRLGLRIKLQLPVACAVRNVSQMAQQGRVMPLLHIRGGPLPVPDALNKVFNVFGVTLLAGGAGDLFPVRVETCHPSP
jgi:hypothetical protein